MCGASLSGPITSRHLGHDHRLQTLHFHWLETNPLHPSAGQGCLNFSVAVGRISRACALVRAAWSCASRACCRATRAAFTAARALTSSSMAMFFAWIAGTWAAASGSNAISRSRSRRRRSCRYLVLYQFRPRATTANSRWYSLLHAIQWAVSARSSKYRLAQPWQQVYRQSSQGHSTSGLDFVISLQQTWHCFSVILIPRWNRDVL